MDGTFHDAAHAVGAAMADRQIGSFVWIDVDNDGDVDLVTFENEGLFLYRNHDGKLSEQTILGRPLAAGTRIGENEKSEWLFDGKLSVSDFDADGFVDLFSASKRGNVLLKNDGGVLAAIDPATLGLPAKSLGGQWVDFDNDGLMDLHLVPQGLFRQREGHRFVSTGLLVFAEKRLQAAISNWFDLDNDGRVDLLMALSEDPKYRRWWQLSAEPRRPQTWLLKAHRNVGARNHWLQVELVGRKGNRQGIGSHVTVRTAEGLQGQEVGSTDGAFFSQGHYRLYFGLGASERADSIKIRWSDGHEQELHDVAADRRVVIERN